MTSQGSDSNSAFPETRWTQVLAVQAVGGSSREADQALEDLTATYWKPVYRFIRSTGLVLDESEDATQAFFAEILSRRLFARADPNQGRFRSFLLGACRRFLAERARNAARLKRGGGGVPIALEELDEPTRSRVEGLTDPRWEAQFDYEWARTLVDQVLTRLRQEYRERGQEPLFQQLERELTSLDEPGVEEALHPEPRNSAQRVAVYRLRQRFRRSLVAEVRHTVAHENEVEDELHHLYRAYTSGHRLTAR